MATYLNIPHLINVTIAGAVTGMASAFHRLRETAMVTIKYKSDRAVVPVVGVIEEEMMLPLVASIQQLYHEYFYTHIELEVSSSGGQAMALAYCVAAMDALRAQGVTFTTRALMSVSSAAANLVSLGDRREASRGATFLYHQTRAGGMETVTVQSARQILTAADKIDGRYLSRLAWQARCSRIVRPALNVKDFSDGDWAIMEYLLISAGVVQATPRGKKPNRRSLLSRLRRHVDSCLQDKDATQLKRLYQGLFELDTPISAALALALRLVDVITELAPRTQPEASADHLCIPEWAPLYRPCGQVPRSSLCRHTLVLGETGSGKTLSGVLPVVGAIMAPANRTVGCALIIDPKREIKAHVARLRHDGIEVYDIDVHRDVQRPVLNLMAGEALSVEPALAGDRYLEAAQQILVRAASLSPTSPARVLAGLPGNRRDAYWESEGSRFAMTVLGLVLLVLKHRYAIYGDDSTQGWLQKANDETRLALLEFGEAAGVVERCRTVTSLVAGAARKLNKASDLWDNRRRKALALADKKRKEAGQKPEKTEAEAAAAAPAKDVDPDIAYGQAQKNGDESTTAPAGQAGAARPDSNDAEAAAKVLSEQLAKRLTAIDKTYYEVVRGVIREFVEALTETDLYQSSPDFRERIKDPLEGTRAAISSEFECGDLFLGTPEHCLSVARTLATAVSKATNRALPDDVVRPAPNILALANMAMATWFNTGRGITKLSVEHIIDFLKQHIRDGDADEIYRKLLSGWVPMARVPDPITFLCIVGFARTCLADYADVAPAHTLFFGVEPYYRSVVAHNRDDRVLVDFDNAVNDEATRAIYLFQPRLDNNEALLARALKAIWFEAILSSSKRQARGGTMPLAAYIADEFHRFVTADKVHGEQSFLDTCRSFGVFCVLACQSLSSIEHALAEGSDRSEMNKAALSIMLNNTANKLFFRSTDQALQAHIDRLCPVTPGLGRVTAVRPPSTLQPGECYASLASGRFERRQLLPFGARQDEAAGDGAMMRVPA